MDEERIAFLEKTLGVDRAGALDIIESDKAIDRGEKLFELSTEAETAAKKARQATSGKPKAKAKREPKVNNDKREIIQAINEALTNFVDDVTVTNEEREIVFIWNDKKYKVTLACPRS